MADSKKVFDSVAAKLNPRNGSVFPKQTDVSTVVWNVPTGVPCTRTSTVESQPWTVARSN